MTKIDAKRENDMIQSKPIMAAFCGILLLLTLSLFYFRVPLFGKEGEAIIDASAVKDGKLNLDYHFSEKGKTVKGQALFGIATGQWKSGSLKVYYLEGNPENHIVGKRGCLPKLSIILLGVLGVVFGSAALSKPIWEFWNQLLRK